MHKAGPLMARLLPVLALAAIAALGGCEPYGDGGQFHQTAKVHAPSRVRPGVARITSRTAW